MIAGDRMPRRDLDVIGSVGGSLGNRVMDALERTAVSKDGTPIAFEQSGRGPALILVSSALADRSDTIRLARRLAAHFTVINYDRRGRGRSGDTQPYAQAREVEDIAALVEAVGGRVSMFGSSSGAVLALDAAQALGSRVEKLALFEPPLIVDGSRAPMPDNLKSELADLIAAGNRSKAVKEFFRRGMGVPAVGVFFIRVFPGWSRMTAMANTAIYDLAILEGTQSGQTLPARRWASVTAKTWVLTGSKSEAFFHSGAKALVALIPDAKHRVLEGQHHGSVVMASKALVETLVEVLK